MLTKTKPARERILLIGGFGAGKSNSWVTVGSWLRRTKSPGRVFVVDTDHAADRLAEGFDDFYENVTPYDVWDYNETLAALRKIRGDNPTREDWLVVDLADKLWEWSQEHFIVEAHGEDAATFFLAHKAAGKDGHPLSGEYGLNWSVVNRLYFRLMTEAMRFPGHVLFCAPGEQVERPNSAGKGGDDKETVALFGRYVKPKGQKALGFAFFTILWMIAKEKNEWGYTTIKDLQREPATNEKMTDFVMDYLVGRAGWVLDGKA